MELNKIEPLGKEWKVRQVAFRLTDQRVLDLMAIAATLPAGATPTETLVRAIELARSYMRADETAAVDAVTALETNVDAQLTDLRHVLGFQGKAISSTQSTLAEIRDLLVAAASATRSESGMDDFDDGDISPRPRRAPPSFGAWLSSSISEAGMKATRSAIATGRLHAIKLVADRMARMTFQVELSAVDGQRLPTPAQGLSVIDPVEVGSPIMKATWGDSLYFVAQPVGSGWKLHIHRSGEGQSSAAIASIMV